MMIKVANNQPKVGHRVLLMLDGISVVIYMIFQFHTRLVIALLVLSLPMMVSKVVICCQSLVL